MWAIRGARELRRATATIRPSNVTSDPSNVDREFVPNAGNNTSVSEYIMSKTHECEACGEVFDSKSERVDHMYTLGFIY
jgi:hypothetical protein